MNTHFRPNHPTVTAFRLPEVGEDVPETFHDWSTNVGLDEMMESGRDEELVINNRDGSTIVASPGEWVVRVSERPRRFEVYKDEAFRRLYLPAEPVNIGAALDRMDALVNPRNKLLAVGAESPTAKGSIEDLAAIRSFVQEAGSIADLIDAAREFVERCERGEVRSLHSHNRFKMALSGLSSARIKPPSVSIDFKQAAELLAMFGGEPSQICLSEGHGHSGPGLYAHYEEMPEEGAIFLGQTDEEATPNV